MPTSSFERGADEFENGHYEEAFKLYKESAEKENECNGYLNLCFCYDEGCGTAPNRHLALYWYGKAARCGSDAAMENIALVYKNEGNLRRARFWYSRAVALNSGDAALELAKIYLNSRRKNRRRAIELLKLAVSSQSVTEASREEAALLLTEWQDEGKLANSR